MNIIATILLAATAFTPAQRLQTFDPDKTSVLSGVEIVCPKGMEPGGFSYRSPKSGIEICKGVFLVPPDGHGFIIQYNKLN